MASLMNGLNAMGQGISNFAGAAGLKQQEVDAATALQRSGGDIAATAAAKLAGTQSDLLTQKAAQEQQMAVLADQLATTREAGGRTQAAGIAEATQGRQQGFQASESALTRQAEADRQQAALNAPSPEIKSAQQFAKLSQDEKRAYREEMMTKAGLPPWMMDDTASGPAPAASPAVTGTPQEGASGTTAPITGAQSAVSAPPGPVGFLDTHLTTSQEAALAKIPTGAQPLVRSIILGLEPPFSPRVAATTYGRSVMDLVRQVEPDTDATTWAGRVATRKAFTGQGQEALAIGAANTAMGHAAHLMDQFDKLGNWSLGEVVNQPANYLMGKIGQGAALKATAGTIDALASEARKIYAGAGGGSVSELNEWKKNFPINGSIQEQRAAIENFVELLDGKLQSLASVYNKGMKTSLQPFQMLDPKPAATYQRILNHESADSTGYQTGDGPSKPTSPSAPVAASAVPSWVKPGDQYSPSRGQARGADGTVYGPQ